MLRDLYRSKNVLFSNASQACLCRQTGLPRSSLLSFQNWVNQFKTNFLKIQPYENLNQTLAYCPCSDFIVLFTSWCGGNLVFYSLYCSYCFGAFTIDHKTYSGNSYVAYNYSNLRYFSTVHQCGNYTDGRLFCRWIFSRRYLVGLDFQFITFAISVRPICTHKRRIEAC